VPDLPAFLLVAVVVIVTPGADTALTIRNTLLGGRRAGIATALGVGLGQATWTVATSVGVAALLVAAAPAFFAVRLVGAGYLLYLGGTSLWSAFRGVPRVALSSPQRPAAAARQGLLSNLTNPKMIVFFPSLLPQFVTQDAPAFATLLALGLVFCFMTVVWLTAYALVVARAGDLLKRSRVRRAIDAVSGAVLLAFGVRVAVSR
jgi:threonine/homoserine/homoserine lactone efflux protein